MGNSLQFLILSPTRPSQGPEWAYLFSTGKGSLFASLARQAQAWSWHLREPFPAPAQHSYLDRKQTQSGRNLDGFLPLPVQFTQMVGGKTGLKSRQLGVFTALATSSAAPGQISPYLTVTNVLASKQNKKQNKQTLFMLSFWSLHYY